MYSFNPSEEQQMLIDVTKRYAENDLRKASHDAEESGELPKNLIEKGWELGLLQASIPAKYGGFGEYSSLTSVLAAEELGAGDLAGAIAVMTPALFAIPILLEGNESQKKEYLEKIVSDNWKPYSAAVIEFDYDFDLNDLKSSAVLDGDEYVLNGKKRYVPYADQAESILVYANLKNKTQAFIVPKGAAGVKIGEREKMLGINGLPCFSIELDNVRIPKGNRLGGAKGHKIEPLLDSARVAISSLAVGLARASFEYARDYAKEREVLGSKVAQKQSIAFFLAEMATEIEAVRLLTWEAAWMLDNELAGASRTAYLALNGAIDMAMMVTDRGVQILGGHGYIREHPVELWMRNGRGIANLTGLAMV